MERQRLPLLDRDHAALDPRATTFEAAAHGARQLGALADPHHLPFAGTEQPLQGGDVGVRADRERDRLDASARQARMQLGVRRVVAEAVGDDDEQAPSGARALELADRRLERGADARSAVRAGAPVAPERRDAVGGRPERNDHAGCDVEDQQSQRIAWAEAARGLEHGPLGELEALDAAAALAHAA